MRDERVLKGRTLDLDLAGTEVLRWNLWNDLDVIVEERESLVDFEG